MSMTKKDYEQLASITLGIQMEVAYLPLSKEELQAYRDSLKLYAERMADELAKLDKRFKRDKFLQQCGVTEHTHDWQMFGKGWKCSDCGDTLDTGEHDTLKD